MPYSPPKLDLTPELRDAFEQNLLQAMRDAVATSKDRDAMLREDSDMLEGLGMKQSGARWEDACNLDFPLIRKAHLTIEGQLISALRREPLVMVESVDPAEEESAEQQERFLSSKGYEISKTAALADVAHFTLKYGLGILYCGWAEKIRMRRSVLLRHKQTGALMPEDGVDEAEQGDYEEEHIREPEITYQNAELRAPDTADFYLYPATARSITSAISCGERIWLSRHDLLLGVDDFGYDRDAVEELIGRPPARMALDSDLRSDQDDEAGVDDPTQQGDGYYECFIWFSKPPLIFEDGDLLTPEYLLHDELFCVACPEARVMLKMEFSPTATTRPYIPFYICPRPGQMYGLSLPQLLYTLATEANVTLRHYIDSLNLDISPAFKVKENAAKINDSFSMFPGALFRVNNMDDIEPFEKPTLTHQPLEIIGLIDTTAKELYAAGGYGSLQGKVRKNSEVKATNAEASSKFDLFLFKFLKGVEDLAALLISLYADHMEEEGEAFMDEEDHSQRITPAQLKGRFIYRAVTTSQKADPDARQEAGTLKAQLTEKYWGFVLQGVPPQILKYLWHAYRKLLIDMDEHRPETYIGEEPQAAPQEGAGPQPQPQGFAAANGAQQGMQPNGTANGTANAAGRAALAQPGLGGAA